MIHSSMGTLRHPKFMQALDTLAAQNPRARAVIDGAVWEIERNPQIGVLVPEIDLWVAKIVLPEPPPHQLLLIYACSRRLVRMLALLPSSSFPF